MSFEPDFGRLRFGGARAIQGEGGTRDNKRSQERALNVAPEDFFQNNTAKRLKEQVAHVVQEITQCQKIPQSEWNDTTNGHTYALNTAFKCVQLAVKLAMAGYTLTGAFDPKTDVCAHGMRFAAEFHGDLTAFSTESDVGDVNKVQKAFQDTMEVFLHGLRSVWHAKLVEGDDVDDTKMIDVFQTLVKSCVTLPVGYTMLHKHNFTGWDERPFDEKWRGQLGIWTTPLTTKADIFVGWKQNQHPFDLTLSDYKIMTLKCIPGVVNIDAYNQKYRPWARGKIATGFRTFATHMQKLCSGVVDIGTSIHLNSHEIVSPPTCQTVMQDVTDDNALVAGRDRTLPKLLDKGFMGWKLLYDDSLERQVVLFPSARQAELTFYRPYDLEFGTDVQTDRERENSFNVRSASLELHLRVPVRGMGWKENDWVRNDLIFTANHIIELFGTDVVESTSIVKSLLDYELVSVESAVKHNAVLTTAFLMKRLQKQPNENESALLDLAASSGRLQVAELLLDEQYGENRACPKDNESRALVSAVRKKDVEMVELLLEDTLAECRARPSDQDSAALVETVNRGQWFFSWALVKLLIDDETHGQFCARPTLTNVKMMKNYDTRTLKLLMYTAAKNGDADVVKLFKHSKAQDAMNQVLFVASFVGHFTAVKTLIDAGADVHLPQAYADLLPLQDFKTWYDDIPRIPRESIQTMQSSTSPEQPPDEVTPQSAAIYMNNFDVVKLLEKAHQSGTPSPR